MFGEPVIPATRIPIELIIRNLSEGATECELPGASPRLTCGDIKAVRCIEPYER